MKIRRKVLIFETLAATPHTETSMEIAFKEALCGAEVFYFPGFLYLPQQLYRSKINGDSRYPEGVQDWWTYVSMMLKPFVQFLSPPDYSLRDQYGPSISRIPSSTLKRLQFDHYLHCFLDTYLKDVDQSTNSPLKHRLWHSFDLTLSFSLETYHYFIEKISPEVTYFFNGRTPSTWAPYVLSREMGLSAVFHERGATKNSYVLLSAPAVYLKPWREAISPWKFVQPDFRIRHTAAAFYNRQKSGRVLNYYFDKRNVDQDLTSISGLSDSYVVFLCSSNFEFDSIPDPDVWNHLGNQLSAITRLREVCNDLRLQLVVRMHPNSSFFDRGRYNNLSDEHRCIVIDSESTISSYTLAERALARFTVGTTMTWELMYRGLSCAILSNSIGQGFPGVVELDSTQAIYNYLQTEQKVLDSVFPLLFGDFQSKFGEPYLFFQPETLMAGKIEPPRTDILADSRTTIQ